MEDLWFFKSRQSRDHKEKKKNHRKGTVNAEVKE